MGYTTDFYGEFTVIPPLKPDHAAYIRRFSETRRMARDESACAGLPDPVRESVGLPVGPEGCYYVGDEGSGLGPNHPSVTDHNAPPGAAAGYMSGVKPGAEDYAQPGLWCQWVPSDDGTAIVWDEGEKFYEYVPWLEYLLKHFLTPWGYALAGMVTWEGEDSDDRGRIIIESPSNEIRVQQMVPTWVDR